MARGRRGRGWSGAALATACAALCGLVVPAALIRAIRPFAVAGPRPARRGARRLPAARARPRAELLEEDRSASPPQDGAAVAERLRLDADFLARAAKFPDLLDHSVAGYLSSWVYSQHENQPGTRVRVPCDAGELSLRVHDVYEDPSAGVTSRLAAVTARYPDDRKVLFFVFKGTSSLTDFVVDVSLVPNYAPFMRAFGDNVSFVHQGVYHGIEQLGIRYSDKLFELLCQEQRAGIDSVIVTGHSLGGMYAKAFMLDVFFHERGARSGASLLGREQRILSKAWRWLRRLEHRAHSLADHRLLRKARCVTFGAPSVFGTHPSGPATPRRDLAAFMRQRAINYVHEEDPCPRAWAHLDVEPFLSELFPQVVRSWLPARRAQLLISLARPLSVFLARQLQARTWWQIFTRISLDTSRQYSELSEVRFLTRGSRRDWREMRGSGNIKDHFLPGYMGCLRCTAACGGNTSARIFGEGGRLLEWKRSRRKWK